MQYVVHRRLRCKCLSGAVNLPFGTICTLNGEILERGKLTQEIQKRLQPQFNPKDEAKRVQAWGRIWNDEKLKPYKMREHPEHWQWNHAFFNADIPTLRYILKVIEGGA